VKVLSCFDCFDTIGWVIGRAFVQFIPQTFLYWNKCRKKIEGEMSSRFYWENSHPDGGLVMMVNIFTCLFEVINVV